MTQTTKNGGLDVNYLPLAALKPYPRNARPLYCDRCLRRWEVYAKDDAVLEATGQTFAEVASARLAHNTETPATE